MSIEKKPACPACGSTEYDGGLKPCTYCDGLKCSMCDLLDIRVINDDELPRKLLDLSASTKSRLATSPERSAR